MTHPREWRRTVSVLLAVAVIASALLGSAPAVAAKTCSSPKIASTIAQRPVILVHGWNSSPDSWAKTIQTLALPPYIAGHRFRFLSFDYSKFVASWPSVPEVSGCLAQMLVLASRAYAKGGGDGKVLAVGHSMGGIALRFASALSFDGTRVADVLAGVVTLGTPHQGSPWGGTWPAAAVQTGKAFQTLSFPPAGSSAEVCLADPARRPVSCTTPPYFPAGVPVTTIGTQIYVERDLFGFGFGPKATFALFGDGLVPQDSANGYIASGPLGGDGKVTRAPRTVLTPEVVSCTYDTSYLSTLDGHSLPGLNPLWVVLGELGTLGEEALDSHAADALLQGSGSVALVELTAYADRTPCFHTHLTSDEPVLDDLYSALTADVHRLAAATTDLSWEGYHGVRLGDTLADAARRLGGTVERYCALSSITLAEPTTVYLGSAPADDGRVNGIELFGPNPTGPEGITVGMTIAHVSDLLGGHLIRGDNGDGAVVYYKVGPTGSTLYMSPGFAGVNTGTNPGPNRIATIGLAASLEDAQAAAGVEGC